MDLSVILVNYKTPEKTIACIDSIRKNHRGDFDLEIIVVDSDSNDDSVEKIMKAHSDILMIESSRNLGMGKGNNLGIKNSKGSYILVLNPDTLIQEKALSNLYSYIRDNERIGVVGPKLLNRDGSLQHSCMRFPKFITPIYRRTFLGKLAKKHLDDFLMKDFCHSKTEEVDWLMGSCLMFKKETVDKYEDVFDKRFFMYFEDTELCRRLKRDGYKIVYHPEAEVIHDHERASADKPWYISPFTDKLTREHIKSWIKYFLS